MQPETLDKLSRTWSKIASRRDFAALLAAGIVAIASRRPVAAAKRCRRRMATCSRRSQCCGRNQHVRCATSHGAGTNTCCGGKGARCTSDLTCCIQHLCHEGTCAPAPL